jgi:hypothetical protein
MLIYDYLCLHERSNQFLYQKMKSPPKGKLPHCLESLIILTKRDDDIEVLQVGQTTEILSYKKFDLGGLIE